MTKTFDAIATVLAETDWKVHFTLTFEEVCRRFDADSRRMNNLMYETFGMSADEIIGLYRTGRLEVCLQKHQDKC